MTRGYCRQNQRVCHQYRPPPDKDPKQRSQRNSKAVAKSGDADETRHDCVLFHR